MLPEEDHRAFRPLPIARRIESLPHLPTSPTTPSLPSFSLFLWRRGGNFLPGPCGASPPTGLSRGGRKRMHGLRFEFLPQSRTSPHPGGPLARDFGEVSIHPLTACHVRRIFRLQRANADGGRDGHAPIMEKDVTRNVSTDSLMEEPLPRNWTRQ